MRNLKKILLALLIVLIGLFIGYNYLYHDHRDISSEEAEIKVNAEKLTKMFQLNEASTVLNKTVVVWGKITEIEDNTFTIDGKVHCTFKVLPASNKIGDSISVKGRCIGYDDLFEIVKLDQCSIL